MIHRARALYDRAPSWAVRPAGRLIRRLPVRVRYGSVFSQELDAIRSPDTGAVVRQRLERVVDAARRTPFWAEQLKGVPTSEVLAALPPLSREAVFENIHEMLDPRVDRAAVKWVTSGGSTGRQLGVWLEKDASIRDWAHVTDAWGRVGYRLEDPRVVLRGVRLGEKQRATAELQPLRNELYLSVFDMDDAHSAAMRDAVRRHPPKYIHGYPSAMEAFAGMYRRAGEPPPPVRALLAISETVHDDQRERLQSIFGGVRLFSFYGLTERVAFAAECESSTDLHVNELYGIVQLVDDRGDLVEEPGVQGEVVSTGLLSAAAPLIRYRTGDVGEWADGRCGCGRTGPRLRRVTGRWLAEFLVTENGSRISMTALNMHSTVFDLVSRFRFVQHAPGAAELKVVPGRGYGPDTRAGIEKELRGKLEGQVELTVREVEEIPLSPVGKHHYIDQLIEDPNSGTA